MITTNRSNFLINSILMSLLLLLQFACGGGNQQKNKAQLTNKQVSGSGEFSLELSDKTIKNTKNNFILVKITPTGSGMELEDFTVTATTEAEGTTMKVTKAGNKSHTYNLDINGKLVSLAAILLEKENKIAQDSGSFKQGQPIAFKIRCEPSLEPEATYDVTVKVEHKNSNTQQKPQTLTVPVPKEKTKKTSNRRK